MNNAAQTITIGERYYLLDLLGEGGMDTAHPAFDFSALLMQVDML